MLLTEIVLQGHEPSTLELVLDVDERGLVGAALGAAGGFAVVRLLNRVDLPSGLHPLFVMASAVLIFALAERAHGSGFLAVYLAGLVVGNRPVRAFPAIQSFHETATWFCQIVMFVVLGLLVTPSNLLPYLPQALLIAAFLILVGRPFVVALCLAPFGFSLAETGFISWVGLRGAVSIFLAAVPTLAGAPGAYIYFNVAFVVVLVSLLVQGWTLTSAARRLGLALPRTAPVPKRVELDLPGQLDQEMVGYADPPRQPHPRPSRPAGLGPAGARRARQRDPRPGRRRPPGGGRLCLLPGPARPRVAARPAACGQRPGRPPPRPSASCPSTPTWRSARSPTSTASASPRPSAP